MKTYKKIIILVITLIVIGFAIFLKNTPNALANISNYFAYGTWKTNSYSTTTLAYITSGTGTTTQLINSDVVGPTFLLDSFSILTQVTATSSTSAQPELNIRIEDSQDMVDWYGRAGVITSTATSTILTGSFGNYKINVATSTADIGPSATTTRVNQSIIAIPVNTRYTRIVYTVPQGGGKLGLWAQIVGKAQRQ